MAKRVSPGRRKPYARNAAGSSAGKGGACDENEELPDFSHLVTEDDTPLDFFTSVEMSLLANARDTSWPFPGVPKLLGTNIGVFSDTEPVIVPDVFLAVGVEGRPPFEAGKRGRSYFMQLYRKAPDVAIEIVVDDEGREMEKLAQYARLGVRYVVFHDPWHTLSPHELRGFYIDDKGNIRESRSHKRFWMPRVGLGLTLWHGKYHRMVATWLRWYERGGRLLQTGGEELAALEARLEEERRLTEQARARRISAEARILEAESRIRSAQEASLRYARMLEGLGVEVE